ncbi:hypothetical protein NDU88_004849 [Pleurodeles waltl]|uniref:Uncharacterized protein n=1 Tax=Pleurodeles waltl TaxID=8319 RepID=A0AAV7W9S3_PLEWA|nr:hypothetical protein NDU88_004849 [Pleurodeles waltl]
MEAGPGSRGHASCRLSCPSCKEPIKGPAQRPIVMIEEIRNCIEAKHSCRSPAPQSFPTAQPEEARTTHIRRSSTVLVTPVTDRKKNRRNAGCDSDGKDENLKDLRYQLPNIKKELP